MLLMSVMLPMMNFVQVFLTAADAETMVAETAVDAVMMTKAADALAAAAVTKKAVLLDSFTKIKTFRLARKVFFYVK